MHICISKCKKYITVATKKRFAGRGWCILCFAYWTHLSWPGSPSIQPKPMQPDHLGKWVPYTHVVLSQRQFLVHITRRQLQHAHAGCIHNLHLIVWVPCKPWYIIFSLPAFSVLTDWGLGCQKAKRLTKDHRGTPVREQGINLGFPTRPELWRLLHPSSHQQDEAEVALNYGYNGYKTNIAIGFFNGNKLIVSSFFFSDLAEELKHEVSYFVSPTVQTSSVVSIGLSPLMHDLLSSTGRCESLLEQWNLGTWHHPKQAAFWLPLLTTSIRCLEY